MSGTAAAGLLGFLFWVVAARTTDPNNVGVATAVIASALLLMSLCDLGMGTALVHFTTTSRARVSELTNTIVAAGWLFSTIAALVFLFGVPLFAPKLIILHENIFLALIFLLFTASNYSITLQDSLALATRNAHYILWRNIACNAPSLLLLPLLVRVESSDKAIVMAYCLPNIIVSIAAGIIILPKYIEGYQLLGFFGRSVLLKILGYGLKSYIGNIIWALPGLLLPIVALNVSSVSDAGKFFLNWTIINFVMIIPRSVTASMFAEGSREPNKMPLIIKRSFIFIFGITLPILGALWFFGGNILRIFGRSYTDTTVLRILLIAVIPFAINSICFIVLRIKKQFISVIGYCIFVAVSLLVSMSILARNEGINGLAMGWLAGHSMGAIMAGLIIAVLCYRRNLVIH